MKFSDFKKIVSLSTESICTEILSDNRNRIRIKKNDVAVKNLVKILDAVLNLANRKGFSAMSLRDLSRETGLSMGALYSYFSSKDELLDMIQRQGMKTAAKVLSVRAGENTDPREMLRQVIFTHLYLSEVMHSWFYFSYMEAKGLGKAQQQKAIESELLTEGIIIDILEEGNGSGVFTVSDVRMVAAGIKSLLQDWYLKRWKYTGRKVSVEDYALFVVDMVEAYIIKKR